MAFTSIIFLCWFLPAFLVVYFAAPPRSRNGILLVASVLFYAWGAPRFVLLLAVTTWIDYVLSRRIASAETSLSARKRLLTLSLALNVGVLGYFKYAGFFVHELSTFLRLLDLPAIPWAAVTLPIGISFITFEKISYIVDVYRGTVAPAERFSDYLLFLALFPHLIAGPIFRYHDIGPQIRNRHHSIEDASEGALRFVWGLSKKVLIADPLAGVADQIFEMRVSDVSCSYAWLGVAAFSFQIYFDFSGYSDMAIGLGRILGFRIGENFNRPYLSASITEFWHRWHISLSSWMREYLYIPLGGNRISPRRTYVNLWIVFLISGLWHGANWTFIAWGAYHGGLLVLERAHPGSAISRLPHPLRVAGTFLLVAIGWAIFRAPSLSEAIIFLGAMFGGVPGETSLLFAEVVSNRALAAFAVAAVVSFVPFTRRSTDQTPARETSDALPLVFRGAAAAACLALSLMSLVNSQFHPFIYFRF